MKRNKLLSFAAVTAATCLCLGTFTACEEGFDEIGSEIENFFSGVIEDIGGLFDDGIYEITYAGESQTYSLSVQLGDEYTIPAIPEKYGCEFIGLFDAEEGGTQYTDENGNSLEPYSNKQDITLYPQYNPQKFTIYFHPDGGMSEQEKIVVSFGGQIFYVPTNLQLEGKDFVGWYTEPGGNGTQVANAAGILFQYSTMNRELGELGRNNELSLYPHFKWKTYTVVAHLESGQIITAQVEHGSQLSAIESLNVPFDGYFITGWKLKDALDGAMFDGIITSDVELVAAKKSKAITLTYDGNGGTTPAPQVVAEGTIVTLSTSKFDGFRFNGWQVNGSGSVIKSLSVGSFDVLLVAEWTDTMAYYSNYDTKTIEDVHTNKNPYDAIPFGSLFGKSLWQLQNEGFQKIEISFSIAINEKDDGYQEIYFGSNTSLDVDNYCGWGRIWYKSDIDTSGYGMYTANFTMNLADIQETMYFCYSANGWWGDAWKREYISVSCTIW